MMGRPAANLTRHNPYPAQGAPVPVLLLFFLLFTALPLLVSMGPERSFTAVTTSAQATSGGGERLVTTYYAAPGKVRVDTRLEKGMESRMLSSVIRLFQGAKVTTIRLYPKKRAYTETTEPAKAYAESGAREAALFAPPKSSVGMCSQLPGRCRRVGSATLLGRAVEDWVLAVPDGKDHTIRLHFWYDRELDFVVKSDVGPMITRKIVSGAPKRSLFEIPRGYTRGRR